MLGILMAAALASGSVEAVDADGKDTARRQWTVCLIKGARDLDDGISDAQTIATAVASTCAQEWQVARAQLVVAQPKAEQWAMMKATEGTNDEMALRAVLTVRKHAAKKRAEVDVPSVSPPPSN